MASHAASAPSGGLTLTIRGTPYPVLLPKVSDPRLHLAAVITTLQVLGQTVFDFRLSIAQILISLLTCAVLEVAITFKKQHVLMWPASALLTGNGVAFILRVPGTEHGAWWSVHGWWIFAATAAVSLLSKYVIVWRGGHVFNPSNIGLVLCFVVLGRERAEPLDFWWGPMSPWLGLALAVIIAGGLLILSRLRLLRVAVGFWLSFAAGIGVLALTGHAMTAHWHLGPITGFSFWWVLLTSPEVLVFLFFMITDPRTSPRGLTARVVYAVSVGLLAALLIAPMQTEYASKVALLAALAIVCALRPLVESVSLRFGRTSRLALAAAGGLAVYSGALALAGIPARSAGEPPVVTNGGNLPALTILPSRGVDSDLDLRTARAIAGDLVAALHLRAPERKTLRVWLEAGEGQDPPTAVAELAGTPYRLSQSGSNWTLASASAAPTVTAPARSLAGFRLVNVAPQVGIHFRHGSFRFGMSNDTPAMMGGGVCWLDYDRDGRLDLFAVNSYADDELPTWLKRGGLPTAALYRNEGKRFVNVSASSHAGVALRGEGCVAADLDGDGYTDLYVTTAVSDVLLWNDGDGTFTEGARAAGVVSFGWHSGAAVADVNGDGRQDLFVAGYTDAHNSIAGSIEGFPGNHEGVRDLLFLNQGNRHFREVGKQAGLDPPPYDHGLGVVFTDTNADGRSDLYVANDEDPNRLYLNERGGPLGFHFANRARQDGVADPNAGMGIAAADYSGDGRADLFVSNSRRQTHAVYRSEGTSFVDARRAFTGALGKNLTGWGDSWVDLNNDGRLDLVVANGAIPVTNLAKNAQAVQVLAQRNGRFSPVGLLRTQRLNGRGVAAADYDNDGRMDLAVSSIGGPLLLLRNTGAVGHWLEVSLPRFAPGARITAVLPDGRRLVREVRAGSSYLSSEDPRVHFGLGAATRVRELVVRYPNGEVVRLRNVAGDRILSVRP